MDTDLNMLKPIKARVKYAGQTCKVHGCDSRPRRNFFCPSHSRQFREGIIDKNGARLKPIIRYSKDFQCIKCGTTTGPFVKGFCKSHYAQLRKGLIDFDGAELRPKKRVMAYGPMDYCKVETCNRRPQDRGFCHNHADAFRRGSYDETGKRLTPFLSKNKGKKCLDCDRPAKLRLVCEKHYYQRYCSSDRPLINKGKQCAAIGCKKDAHCKGLCITHYARRKSRLQSRLPQPASN